MGRTMGNAGGRGPRFHRAVTLTALQNLLIAGIVAFSLGVVVLYSNLTKIEQSQLDLDVRLDGRMPRSRREEEPASPEVSPEADPRLLRNDNHRNPGRGWGSRRGRVRCDVDVSRLVSYWDDPRSDADRAFASPFLEAPPEFASGKQKANRTRYLSFEPDLGGWNNIRMQFEIMFVLAAATGRTLVLPPGSPLYLLYKDKTKVHRGIQDFFHPFGDVVGTISTEDFFRIEVLENKHYPLPTDETNRTKLIATLQNCIWMAKSEISCFLLNEYLTEVADYVPQIHGEHQCLVMDDENWFREAGRGSADSRHPDLQNRIRKFCDKRTPVYYDNRWHDAPLLHFHSHTMTTRLLLHFYAFVYFTNPKVGNYYKRLVRDRVRYSDEIFCAAGKIVKALVEESMARNFNGDGAEAGYYAMHIRRGDFQWANMRLSSQEWYNNTQYWLKPGADHSIYIATDERNRTFFEPFMKNYRVSFLDDYSELANLSNLDPNYVGMIDQVVASRSRLFVGTYFSSFSAYIGRMRGYHGLPGKRMFYSHPNYWNQTHAWAYPHSSYSAREYPIGWVGIDEDDEPDETDFY